MINTATSASTYLVAVLYNGAEVLPSFLESLKAQRYQGWNLVIVDNASSDASSDVLKTCEEARIKVVRNHINVGFAKAANQGLRYAFRAGGELFFLINLDTVFDAAFLGDLLNARHRLNAQVITPRIMQLRHPEKAWYAGGHFDNTWVFTNVHEDYDHADTTTSRYVEFASGCCLGFTRDVLTRVGLLDERFFVYWEDVDFCLRLSKERVPIVYTSEPSLLHVGSASTGGYGTPMFIELYYRSYGQFLRKHFGIFVAFRTAIRLLAREIERPTPDYSRMFHVINAMLKGMARPFLQSKHGSSSSLSQWF